MTHDLTAVRWDMRLFTQFISFSAGDSSPAAYGPVPNGMVFVAEGGTASIDGDGTPQVMTVGWGDGSTFSSVWWYQETTTPTFTSFELPVKGLVIPSGSYGMADTGTGSVEFAGIVVGGYLISQQPYG